MSLTDKYLKNQINIDEKKEEVETQDDQTISENVSTILDTATKIPGQMYDMATGEYKQLEFPDAKETTQIDDVGFFETLVPNLKMMFARNDFGKAEILGETF